MPAMRRMTQKQFDCLPVYAKKTIITYEITIEKLREENAAYLEMIPVSNIWFDIGHGAEQRRIFIPNLARVGFAAENFQDLLIRQQDDGIFVHSDAMIHILPRASNAVKLISEVD